MIRLEECVWKEGSLFITSSRVDMLSTWLIYVDAGLDHLVEFRLSVFSTVKCCSLWKEVPMCNPLWQSWEPASSWGQSSYINYLEFWIREFSCFLLYLFNQLLFISLCTQVHLFHISGYNSVLLYLFDQIVSPLDTGSSFSWLLYPVSNSPSVWCVFSFDYIFAFWKYKMFWVHLVQCLNYC